MNSRDAQDVLLRLLADGPFRTAVLSKSASADPEAAAVAARTDLAALDRFGRFLCRHYYRERIVHYFKYSRALAPLTGRAPEAMLKTDEFKALVPRLVLGERSSAKQVLALLKRLLTTGADEIRARIPFWDDLLAYQGALFLSDALPPAPHATHYPARAETSLLLEFEWDLPAILPQLLKLFRELPLPPRKATRLLFARSPHGEVTALRCTDALRTLLESLTGERDPSEVAQKMGLDAATFEKTLKQLEQLGAVITRESFSSSHVGSDLSGAAGAAHS